MEENTKRIIIISAIVIALLTIGAIVYVTKFRNKDPKNTKNENETETNYVEDKLLDLDEVAKKDRNLVQDALYNVPFQNGLYQSIYNTEKVKIEDVKKELLFNKAYYKGVDKIESTNKDYEKIIADNNIERADFFVTKENISKNIKNMYDLTITELPSEVELIGGNAKLYGDYYGFVFASEASGFVKISKVLSYTISDNSLVIYEKPAFVTYDFETNKVYLYSDDKGENLVLTIENENNSTSDNVLKKFKDNLSLFNTYEHFYEKKGDNYYWKSVGTAKEDK